MLAQSGSPLARFEPADTAMRRLGWQGFLSSGLLVNVQEGAKRLNASEWRKT